MGDYVTREEFNKLKESIDSLYGALEHNTRTTKENNVKSEELLILYGDVKGWLRIGRAMGDLFGWLAKIAVGVGILWVVFKFGVQEAWRAMTGKG